MNSNALSFMDQYRHRQNQNNKPHKVLIQEEVANQTRYICGYCKGVGHNARSCKLRKNAKS